MLMRSNGHKSPIIAAHYYENTTIETEISVVYTDQRRQITKMRREENSRGKKNDIERLVWNGKA